MLTEVQRFDDGDPEKARQMNAIFGPQQVDTQIRQAIQFCRMILPPDRRNVEDVKKEIRRVVERALRDLREDFDSFGLGK